MATRRAVLYGRVSKLPAGAKGPSRRDHIEGKSVDQQLRELARIAERDQVEVVGVYRDDGISASRYASGRERAGWRDVMTAIMDGTASELWAWEISRATRDRPVWAALINTCIAQNAKITISGRVHDPNDPDDGFMLDLMAALAVRESAVTSKRIRRDVAARAAEGHPHGKIPYGYRREYDQTSGALLRQVPDEPTATVVREICRRLLDREALYAVAADLTRRGIAAPRGAAEWDPVQVRRIAINPTYAGLRTHQGVTVGPARWPGLISESDHLALVDNLDSEENKAARRSWRDGSVKHLLVGIAVCGVCGSRCRRVKNRGTPSYMCAKRFCVSRAQLPTDEFVTAVVIARLSRPDALELLADDSGDTSDAVAELRDLRTRLDAFYDEAVRGKISPQGLARVETRLLADIKAAERRAVPRGLPPSLVEVAGSDVAAAWEELSVPQRRELVRALLVPRILLAGKGTRRFNPETISIAWRGSE